MKLPKLTKQAVENLRRAGDWGINDVLATNDYQKLYEYLKTKVSITPKMRNELLPYILAAK